MKTLLTVVPALWLAACGLPGTAGPVVTEHHAVDRGAATAANVVIDMSAGDLDVNPGTGKLFEGEFAFNVPALKPDVAYVVKGDTGELKVSQGSSSGNVENKWRLSLDQTTPLDLTITMGAGDATLELGRLNLRSLAIRLGAGDLKIDLRGTPSKSYGVKVQAGAGDTTIELPASVAISASTSGLIGDSNVNGLEKRDGRWINPRAQESPVTVTVDVQHAIGDLRISAE
jgi:hypothetical protein